MSTSVSEQDVLSALSALASIWPNREMTPESCRLYWVAVRHLTREQFIKAVEIAVKSCKYFPAPAEILEFAPTVSETQPWTVQGDIRRSLPEPEMAEPIKELIKGLVDNVKRMPSSRDMGVGELNGRYPEFDPRKLVSTPEQIERQEYHRERMRAALVRSALDRGEITPDQYEQFKATGQIPTGKYEATMSSGDAEWFARLDAIRQGRQP